VSNRKPILCLDFDGVIHSYASGWKGIATIPDPPVPGAIEFIERSQADFTVAIYSTRSRSLRGRFAMKRWIERWVHEKLGHGFEADDVLVSIRWPWFKPSAFLTIDDRAITFTGEWPDPVGLLNFQPWNKRAAGQETTASPTPVDLPGAIRDWLGPVGIARFREIRARHGGINAVFVERGLPHAVHFREGMAVRNKLRELTGHAWTSHEYDDQWVGIVEEAIGPVEAKAS
jgi:hypothetical protein